MLPDCIASHRLCERIHVYLYMGAVKQASLEYIGPRRQMYLRCFAASISVPRLTRTVSRLFAEGTRRKVSHYASHNLTCMCRRKVQFHYQSPAE